MTIPTDDMVVSETMMQAHRLSLKHNATLSVTKGCPHDYVRNMAAMEFLKSDSEWLFSIDSDVVPPMDAIDLMLEHGDKIVSGVYPVAIENKIVWAVGDYEDGKGRLYSNLNTEPFYAGYAGAGCLLVHREVFEMIEFPWFLWGHRKDGGQTGEDFYFFNKCKENGYRLKVDPRVVCGHYKRINITSLIRKD